MYAWYIFTYICHKKYKNQTSHGIFFFVYLPWEWVDFYGKSIGKYTMHPWEFYGFPFAPAEKAAVLSKGQVGKPHPFAGRDRDRDLFRGFLVLAVIFEGIKSINSCFDWFPENRWDR